ncbi:FKBP-type peptidyl-prolyl cis-trans isomerase [Streptomyces aidingensis]|uniref:peptidylprolyl isomerase n=1 Tax=Streptomyces aidingensis TaxID=910347 RepID=A0A1I1RZ12_9ACTN|nr:FKBP-type peptidyl-prolyl cis-trans isomerase [Streptomyces aidingensis]SFD39525.1 FKBP-type peptidyl-prolyl cis-trans isomerase [Streptomyces aidingensis]
MISIKRPTRPTRTARRLAAALAVPVLLLTAACGSDSGNSGNSADAEETQESESNAPWPLATVTGAVGEEPAIEVPDGAETSSETVVTVLEEGDGPTVAENDYLRVSLLARGLKEDEEDLVNTWSPRTAEDQQTEGSEGSEGSGETAGQEDAEPVYAALQMGKEDLLPLAVTDPLVGKPEGSRVVIQGAASELIGAVAENVGFQPGDSVVFVYDIVTVIDPLSMAEGEQAAAGPGMPEVQAGEPEAASITVPEGEEPPAEIQQQVLIEGDGAEVKANQQLIVQYTGVKWSDGEKFDSSWDHGGASKFPIGAGGVIAGWDETLVGKHVGDRVLLVIPPEKAYGVTEEGAEPAHELADQTLVFVVDILDAI